MFKKIIEKIYLSFNDNLVSYDSTTKCRSRYYFDNVLNKKYRNRECTVVFIDINNLKYINDTHGHTEGTRIIQETAQVLLNMTCVYDICRIGGDEFVLIGSSHFDITQLHNIQYASYGYCFKSKQDSLQKVLLEAEKYMYRNKKGGKNNEHD